MWFQKAFLQPSLRACTGHEWRSPLGGTLSSLWLAVDESKLSLAACSPRGNGPSMFHQFHLSASLPSLNLSRRSPGSFGMAPPPPPSSNSSSRLHILFHGKRSSRNNSLGCCLWWFYIISLRPPAIGLQRSGEAGPPPLELLLRRAIWQSAGLIRNLTRQEGFSSLMDARSQGPRAVGTAGSKVTEAPVRYPERSSILCCRTNTCFKASVLVGLAWSRWWLCQWSELCMRQRQPFSTFHSERGCSLSTMWFI